MVKTIKDVAQEQEEKISIVDLFADHEMTEQNKEGTFKMECPSCGLQGGRTQGFILFENSNVAYCQSVQKTYSMLEAYAIKNGIVKCIDKEDGESLLQGELFTEVLDTLKEEFDDKTYNMILSQAKVRKMVELPGDGILDSAFADTLAKTIKYKDTMFYRSEVKALVEIGNIKTPDGDETYSGIMLIEPARYVTLIEQYFKPWSWKYKMNGQATQTLKSLSTGKAKIMMVSNNFRNAMPILNRIFTVPIPIIKDGKLSFPKKGYDKRYGSYLPYNSPQIIKPDMELEEAIKIINYIYQEFCFKDEQARSNAIAGLLTPFIRGLLPKFSTRAPVFTYVANRERAGKDYCANITGLLYEGVALEESPISSGGDSKINNDELRKKIFAALLKGRKRMHFSNNKGKIDSGVFESATTAEEFSDRVLGVSDDRQLANEIDYSLSGNLGITLTPDLIARSRFVALEFTQEDPNSRVFKNPDLHGWILDNREMIISALYSLVRNWMDKGKPEGNVFSSFPKWAKICGGIMQAAGLGDPCVPYDDEDYEDNNTKDIKILYEILYEKYPNDYIEKSKILDEIYEHGEIYTWIDRQKPGTIKSFWKEFRGKVRREFGGKKMLIQKGSRIERDKFGVFEILPTNQSPSKTHDLVGTGRFYPSNEFLQGVNKGRCETPTKTYHTYQNKNTPKLAPSPIKHMNKVSYVATPKKENESDRQVQFWEAEECEYIKPVVTKEEVLNEIKSNPKQTIKEIYNKLGLGSTKFIVELIREKTITKDEEDRLWNVE